MEIPRVRSKIGSKDNPVTGWIAVTHTNFKLMRIRGEELHVTKGQSLNCQRLTKFKNKPNVGRTPANNQIHKSFNICSLISRAPTRRGACLVVIKLPVEHVLVMTRANDPTWIL